MVKRNEKNLLLKPKEIAGYPITKPVNTRNTVVWVCSVSQCAKIQNHTHTHGTHFGNTVGIPIPILNPKSATPNLWMLLGVLLDENAS